MRRAGYDVVLGAAQAAPTTTRNKVQPMETAGTGLREQ